MCLAYFAVASQPAHVACCCLTPPCRPRVQAITAGKQGDDSRVIMALLQLGAVLDGMPCLDEAGAEAELIAGAGRLVGGGGAGGK